MSEWQDISTAPKDGRQLLLWCVFDDAGEITIARFIRTEAKGAHGLFCWEEGREGGAIAEKVPTHWMPLPDPPERAAAPHITQTEAAAGHAAGDAAHNDT